MARIAVITDTGADNLSELISLGVDFVPLYITFDGTNYIKQIVNISIEDFYEKLKTTTFHPKTSLPSVMDYVDNFNKHLANGEEIIYIALNSKFSGSYQASLSARDIILEETPDAKIEIIDSLSCTYTQYMIVKEAAIMANKGKSIEEIKEKVEKLIPTGRIFLTVDSLNSLKESGRVSNFSAALGGLLNIKPILKFEDGVLAPTSKVKGMNKALSSLINDVKEYVDANGGIENFDFGILHGNREQDAFEFGENVKEELGIDNVNYCLLGVCIGLHAGPTLLGIGCIKKATLV